MNVIIKIVRFVIGVDCAGQPITINHSIKIEEEKPEVGYSVFQNVKITKYVRNKVKLSKVKRHCGHSQKDIRVRHK